MSQIRLLPPPVIAAIAAGEVIERPANVVKELIENSLDAGATSIKVDLEHHGLRSIMVTDNGKGIPKDELHLALKRHATSKLQQLDDFQRLSSLGFRGEALASIASISRLTLLSRPANQTTGYQVIAHRQQLTEPEPIGMPVGTTIKAEYLFQDVPVRLRFLKNPASELRHILEVVSGLALAYPQVKFQLVHQRHTLLSLREAEDTFHRIQDILGSQLEKYVIPFESIGPKWEISGYITTPQANLRVRDKQFLFINQRLVQQPILIKAVKRAYGTLLTATSQPSFVLYITLSGEYLDVNVHPQKNSILIADEPELAQTLTQALQDTLRQADVSYQYQIPESQPLVLRDSGSVVEAENRQASLHTSDVMKSLTELWQTQPQDPGNILQYANTYLVAMDQNGILMVDQHAAHERILYHRYSTSFAQYQTQPELRELQPPEIISTNPLDAQVLSEAKSELKKLGFEYEAFGAQTFKCTHVPSIYADRTISDLLVELAHQVINTQANNPVDTTTERTLKFLACRQAIQAGDPLALEERQRLIQELATTPNNVTCPHGRPTTMRFSKYELEKLFHRR
jgi:DNA mismatch repair protein MutL